MTTAFVALRSPAAMDAGAEPPASGGAQPASAAAAPKRKLKPNALLADFLSGMRGKEAEGGTARPLPKKKGHHPKRPTGRPPKVARRASAADDEGDAVDLAEGGSRWAVSLGPWGQQADAPAASMPLESCDAASFEATAERYAAITKAAIAARSSGPAGAPASKASRADAGRLPRKAPSAGETAAEIAMQTLVAVMPPEWQAVAEGGRLQQPPPNATSAVGGGTTTGVYSPSDASGAQAAAALPANAPLSAHVRVLLHRYGARLAAPATTICQAGGMDAASSSILSSGGAGAGQRGESSVSVAVPLSGEEEEEEGGDDRFVAIVRTAGDLFVERKQPPFPLHSHPTPLKSAVGGRGRAGSAVVSVAAAAAASVEEAAPAVARLPQLRKITVPLASIVMRPPPQAPDAASYAVLEDYNRR